MRCLRAAAISLKQSDSSALPLQNTAMPNIASVLKAEIARVARKEVRAEVEALKRASTQQRSAIAALRRQVEALQKELRRASKQTLAPQELKNKPAANDGIARRFSATRMAAHRAKLGVSAIAYGKLVGIGGQTIYNWEQGKSRPNPEQILTLALARQLPRSELLARMGVTAEE